MNLPAPSVSIVIATRNAGATLERCLASIMGQDCNAWELLIVDCLSDDGTQAIIERFLPHITWSESAQDRGIYDAWNKAIAKASAEYICFLGADDFFSSPDAISRIISAAADGDMDLVTFRGIRVSATGQTLGLVGRAWDWRGLRRRMGICHPGAFFRRSLFDELGTFDTRYKIAGDYDWMLRLPRSTRAAFIPEPLISLQDGGVSRSQADRMAAEYWSIQTSHPRVGRIMALRTAIGRYFKSRIARLLSLHY